MITAFSFSPTGGTDKVLSIISEELHVDSFHSLLKPLETPVTLSQEDTAIIAFPSFGGRMPRTAKERFESAVRGNGAKCIIITVYGNRAYEDTLIEMLYTAESCGFSVIAAISAVAEHSIFHAVATGRPDEDDRAFLINATGRIREKIKEGRCDKPSVPGKRPYKEYGAASFIPMPDDRCINCGRCSKECPVGAIDADNPHSVDAEKCISCMRCIAVCPISSRKNDNKKLAMLLGKLESAFSGRKKNEIFL